MTDSTNTLDTAAAREAILRRIRDAKLPEREHPGLDGPWIAFDDPIGRFCEVLESVGGGAIRASSAAAAAAELRQLPQIAAARRVFSQCPELLAGNVSLDDIDDPHDLGTIDAAVIHGEWAAAENAAVWVTDAALRHRAVAFWAEHLVIAIPVDRVLSNLHQVYEHLTFSPGRFGVFISGPSKTADIEQSLVIGAQGPRSLTMCLLPAATD